MIPRTARSHLCHALSRERAQYANFDDLISFTQVTFAMVSRLTLLAAVLGADIGVVAYVTADGSVV